MWDRQKKRKAPSGPNLKAWKGCVLVQNKTVKKSETTSRKIVWFSAKPAEDLASQVIDFAGKAICPEPIKARHCMDFELHFKMRTQFPPSIKLLVFAALFKADTGEEIKEGVVNNFAYLQCSTLHGVAVFQKLYLETRSQFSHYLEFTLWAEKLNVPVVIPELGKPYDRETYYPILGSNTFRTHPFIPSVPSSKHSHSEEIEVDNTFRFIKMVPQFGEANSTVYLTFGTRNKESSGEIFVVWNDEIFHLPFYTKGGSERLIIFEKIPASTTQKVAVYLKERPPQDSRQSGSQSNALYFEYTGLIKQENQTGGATTQIVAQNSPRTLGHPAINPTLATDASSHSSDRWAGDSPSYTPRKVSKGKYGVSPRSSGESSEDHIPSGRDLGFSPMTPIQSAGSMPNLPCVSTEESEETSNVFHQAPQLVDLWEIKRQKAANQFQNSGVPQGGHGGAGGTGMDLDINNQMYAFPPRLSNLKISSPDPHGTTIYPNEPTHIMSSTQQNHHPNHHPGQGQQQGGPQQYLVLGQSQLHQPTIQYNTMETGHLIHPSQQQNFHPSQQHQMDQWSYAHQQHPSQHHNQLQNHPHHHHPHQQQQIGITSSLNIHNQIPQIINHPLSQHTHQIQNQQQGHQIQYNTQNIQNQDVSFAPTLRRRASSGSGRPGYRLPPAGVNEYGFANVQNRGMHPNQKFDQSEFPNPNQIVDSFFL